VATWLTTVTKDSQWVKKISN